MSGVTTQADPDQRRTPPVASRRTQLCPKCGSRPSRVQRRRSQGRRAFCVLCWQATRAAHWRATTARRSAARAAARDAAAAGSLPPEPETRAEADLPEAEIERRYQAALRQLRRPATRPTPPRTAHP